MDLHVHSVYSDGLKTPEQLCALAGRLGIAYLALCDHDTVNGLDPMAQAIREENRTRETRGQPPLTLIPCVEISTGPGGRTHLLAYGASPRNARLTAFLSGISAERRIRAGRMLEQADVAIVPREDLAAGLPRRRRLLCGPEERFSEFVLRQAAAQVGARTPEGKEP